MYFDRFILVRKEEIDFPRGRGPFGMCASLIVQAIMS